jgi:hypothetical protein
MAYTRPTKSVVAANPERGVVRGVTELQLLLVGLYASTCVRVAGWSKLPEPPMA